MESSSNSDSDSSGDDELVTDLLGTIAAASRMAMDQSDNDSSDSSIKWGGSRKGKAPNIARDFAGAYSMVVQHYFSGMDSLYTEEQFERRFGAPRSVVSRIYNAVRGYDPFLLKTNRAGMKPGIRPLVRIVAAFRMLVYGDSADHYDEHLQISETEMSSNLKSFCQVVIANLGERYLNRCPTAEEKSRSTQLMSSRGFPGCFASWDCKHYDWQNCPVRLAGQYKGKAGGKKTIVMEAICDPHLYLWHFHWGEAGSLNDLNILDRSTIVEKIINQEFNTRVPPYSINGTVRDWLYFLVDGIYPRMAIFVKTHPSPITQMERQFTKRHEHVRKDIERCFGVLVKKFGILKQPFRNWYLDDITQIVECCVIIHNMTIDERRQNYTFNDVRENGEDVAEDAPDLGVHESLFGLPEVGIDEETGAVQAARVANMMSTIEDTARHYTLQHDLYEHISNVYYNNNND